jgi:hypothetical protein
MAKLLAEETLTADAPERVESLMVAIDSVREHG